MGTKTFIDLVIRINSQDRRDGMAEKSCWRLVQHVKTDPSAVAVFGFEPYLARRFDIGIRLTRPGQQEVGLTYPKRKNPIDRVRFTLKVTSTGMCSDKIVEWKKQTSSD